MRISDWSSDVCSSDLYNTTQQITVYDLELLGGVPIAFDYAKLLRQGRRVGTVQEEHELLIESAEQCNSIRGKEMVPPEKLPEFVVRSSPYKALRLASAAWNQPEKFAMIRSSLQNALDDLVVLEHETEVGHSNVTVLSDNVKYVTDALAQKAQQ